MLWNCSINMLRISLQNNLSPKNYSHNLMLSLDMLYTEVGYYILEVIVICRQHEYKRVMILCLLHLFSIVRYQGCWLMLWSSCS